MRHELKQLLNLAVYTAVFFALLMVALASCKQQQPSTSVRVKPLPKGNKAAVSPDKPELLRAEKAGDDTRYVISFEGTEFHIVAGEKGIFGIKVIAPVGTQRWTSIWLDFYPATPRPRAHTTDELSTSDVAFDHVTGDFRGYVQKTRRLANELAPQAPKVGDAAKAPRAARLKLKGLDLPPVAANELAIFGRTNNIQVIVNEAFPMRPLPAEVKNIGEMQFGLGTSELGFVSGANWARMKMTIKIYEINLMAINRGSGVECYLDFAELNGNYKDLEAVIKVDSGLINISRFDPVKAGEEKQIDEEYRAIAGMLLTVMDNQLFDPPQEYKSEIITALTAINHKGTAQTYAHMKERKGGVEDLLFMLGKQ